MNFLMTDTRDFFMSDNIFAFVLDTPGGSLIGESGALIGDGALVIA